MMAEIVDMGATVRSSMTRYVTPSFTYPPGPSPAASCACACASLPCASPGVHRISTVIGCRHAGHGRPDTSVTFIGFPAHEFEYLPPHRKYRFAGGGGGGGGSAPSPSSSKSAADGNVDVGLRRASRFGEAETKNASSRDRAPA
uniref:Uncharacterized protein n=1 Tax=Arundo donax TaxID=35708 RepID=A0A0A9BSZ4_ARUDO